jgi:hypothetical protein
MRSSMAFVGAALVMALAGCSSSSNAGPDLGAFEGTWTPTAVTEVVTCNGTPTTSSITANLTWAQSATNSSEIVSSSTGGSCTFTASVSGSTATATAGQTCTETEPAQTGTETINLTLGSYSFAVSSDDKTAQITGNGSANIVLNGATTSCTYTESGSYTKSTN